MRLRPSSSFIIDHTCALAYALSSFIDALLYSVAMSRRIPPSFFSSLCTSRGGFPLTLPSIPASVHSCATLPFRSTYLAAWSTACLCGPSARRRARRSVYVCSPPHQVARLASPVDVLRCRPRSYPPHHLQALLICSPRPLTPSPAQLSRGGL
jgi:hypothetical protein